MDETKGWWLSTTIWASLVQIAVFGLLGLNLVTAGGAAAITTELPNLLVNVAGVITGAIALYGRATASKMIA